MTLTPLAQVAFDAASLLADHPPRWRDPNKRTVYKIASSSGAPFEGEMIYARWPAAPLPNTVQRSGEVEVRPGVFDYKPSEAAERMHWHMNFADRDLFVAYGSSLLAQDELQVAEHPLLGSVREALVAMGLSATTVGHDDRPTPVTISGVQRRCWIDTSPNKAQGRPFGLYGNAFGRAPIEEIRVATHALHPPTFSNILAMAAPSGGSGIYQPREIQTVLTTAYSGFLAAREASQLTETKSSIVTVHTGFWGCGAFGGNRDLMTILQVLAADLADVELVFHAFDEAGSATANRAIASYQRLREQTDDVPGMLGWLARQGYAWGSPDGN
jgi:hypothetical protein